MSTIFIAYLFFIWWILPTWTISSSVYSSNENLVQMNIYNFRPASDFYQMNEDSSSESSDPNSSKKLNKHFFKQISTDVSREDYSLPVPVGRGSVLLTPPWDSPTKRNPKPLWSIEEDQYQRRVKDTRTVQTKWATPPIYVGPGKDVDAWNYIKLHSVKQASADSKGLNIGEKVTTMWSVSPFGGFVMTEETQKPDFRVDHPESWHIQHRQSDLKMNEDPPVVVYKLYDPIKAEIPLMNRRKIRLSKNRSDQPKQEVTSKMKIPSIMEGTVEPVPLKMDREMMEDGGMVEYTQKSKNPIRRRVRRRRLQQSEFSRTTSIRKVTQVQNVPRPVLMVGTKMRIQSN